MNYHYFFFLLLFLTSCQQKSAYRATDSTIIIGQTVPQDMIFIEGEGDMPSFYISEQEEPVINYLIYLKWLDGIFGESYPEVYQAALPASTSFTFPMKSAIENDDLFANHTAYLYYPMTGLTWLQIQNYLAWKTDRMNEIILINAGFLNFNGEQKDEDNFTTETSLFEQYMGDVRSYLKDEKTNEERSYMWQDGIFHAGFRLPTAAEWTYAAQSKFQRPLQKNYSEKPLKKHPYGATYYLNVFGNYYDLMNRYYDLNYADFKLNMEVNMSANKDYPLVTDYDARKGGLINMQGGAKEWVLDIYKEKENTQKFDLEQIMNDSGFETPTTGVVDENGEFVEKDSLGRMRNFRILGNNTDNTPLLVSNYKPKNNTKITRTIYGGTYNQPSLNRTFLEENKQANDVGFRVILPYTAMPTKHKIQWSYEMKPDDYR